MFSRFARFVGFLTMAALGFGLGLLVAGFFWFVDKVPTREAQIDGNADGIVVLTGAASRIPDAIELLAAGRGQRLLITGVHRATSAKEIARLTPLYQRVFSCCVDLDRSALNTLGNATETRRYARQERIPVWDMVEGTIRAGATYPPSFYVLLVAAALIAAVGILTNSQILVVGAMVVGPEYSAIIDRQIVSRCCGAATASSSASTARRASRSAAFASHTAICRRARTHSSSSTACCSMSGRASSIILPV